MKMMTPIDYYHNACKKGIVYEDPQQLSALNHLQRVYKELMEEDHKRASFYGVLRRPRLVRGVYLWGGVGIGKTFLMDCFYQALPIKKKMRMHFHQFMQWIHTELKKHQGKMNPLEKVAEDIAKNTIILCFDELFVSDITDAMLLGRLFKEIFSRGVALVTTSNSKPDDLYKNGLQREQFLPAIETLKTHLEVVHLPSTIDYRLRHLQAAGVFYSPLNAEAKQKMEKSFRVLTAGKELRHNPIVICDRPINIKKAAGDVVWFDFIDICTVPRSQKDYLEIAKNYRTVFISDIPIIPPNAKDMICLFICLVDVMYDARVRMLISAAEPVSEIYSRGYMILEYTRTHSRLLEMQSLEYFGGEGGKLL